MPRSVRGTDGAAPAFDPYREEREKTMRRLAKELPDDEDTKLAVKQFEEDIRRRDENAHRS